MRSNPKWLVWELIERGMTEMDIVRALRLDGVEVTQATISRIKSGDIKNTRFEIGMGLVRLHDLRADVRQQRA